MYLFDKQERDDYMIKDLLIVSSNKKIANNVFEMTLSGELVKHVQSPGQFLHIKVGDDLILRRPISIASIDYQNEQLTIVYKKVGKGTKWLSERYKGDYIDVLGPLGNGFKIDQVRNKNILVIGGGVGIPPLYELTKQLSKNNHVTVILGFQSESDIFYEEKFSKIAFTIVTTDDGSYGHKGVVTDLIDYFKDEISLYYACGPLMMLKNVREKLNHAEGHLSIEEQMGCGIGACFACVCLANNEKGYVKVCKDGPVFNADEVIL